MKRNIWPFLNRIFHDQNAQILPMMALFMVGFMGMVGCVIDIGNVYYAYNQLQASTNAAALAGAAAISNPNLSVPGYTSSTITPTAVADYYGSMPGGLNVHSVLNSYNNVAVSTTVNLSCNSFVQNTLGVLCITYPNECGASACAQGTTGVNAIQVVQVAEVKTYFAALLGTPYITLTASAAAARAGAPAVPQNVAIIIDTTSSMSSTDNNCSNQTRLACALGGVRTLLSEMAPCYSNENTSSGCGGATNGFVSPSVDRVALFTFPNLAAPTGSITSLNTNIADDYTCSTTTSKTGTVTVTNTNPAIQPYSFPSAPTSSSSYTSTLNTATGLNSSYEISYGLGNADNNGFINDYKTADSTTALNALSDVVIAVGGGSTCSGVSNPGGAGTFYAGAIYAATAALAAEQANNPNSENVIILVSDGDATSSGTHSYDCTKYSGVSCSCTTTNCLGSVTANEMGSATSQTTYPGTKDECGQAITAANYAITSGIVQRIYAVAYGAETSGCTTDGKATYSFQGTSSDFEPSPCSTMEDIASSPNYFYSDYNQSGGGNDTSCIGQNTSNTSLTAIFSDIASDFTTARLIPNSEY